MNATPNELYPDSGAEVAAGMAPVDTTATATETTLLNPRFYTTDFDEMDRVDVTPVRAEWDRLTAQMKSDPKLTTSFASKLWIRFFLTAVYSTMGVRDHARPEFHKALGVDIGWYDQEVFRKTSTIARQIFPIEIDIDHPRWIPNLKRMNAAFLDMDAAKKQGGVVGKLNGWGAAAKAALAFASPYLIPVRKQDLPANVRLEPSY